MNMGDRTVKVGMEMTPPRTDPYVRNYRRRILLVVMT
jgi:hypothetical protein